VPSSIKNAVSVEDPVTFVCFGIPQPKGSKSVASFGNKTFLVEGTLGGKTKEERTRNRANVKKRYDWFSAVELAARQLDRQPFFDGALEVVARFWFPCGKKDIPGSWHTKKPDFDKLYRAIGDSITKAGVIRDDARIARPGDSYKRYCRAGESPRVEITIRQLEAVHG